jgi:hypothetical protein
MRRICGQRRDKVTGGWRNRHKELHNLHSSPSINKMNKPWRIRWATHVASIGERFTCKILVGTSKGNRPVGRSRDYDGIVQTELLLLGIGLIAGVQ